jgi:putative sterol carrier protein
MSHPVFSDAWARACGERINASAAYRTAAQRWEGAILLRITADAGIGGEERAVWLDLWHGECRQARGGNGQDHEAARYVLAGTLTSWRAVLTGQVAPLMALLTGRLSLAKGNVAELLPFVGAASELVAAASAVATDFPDGPA